MSDRSELPRGEFNLPPGVSSRMIEDAQETDTPAPGPYRVDGWTILDRDGNLIAEVFSDASGDQAEATVRLLAAAWAMRDMLRELLEEHDSWDGVEAWQKARHMLRRVEAQEP